MTFLRELLAVIIGVFISFMIMFFVFVAIGSVISSSFVDDSTVVVKKNSVLVLKLEDLIKDYAPKNEDPFSQILGLEEKKMGLDNILNAIDNAKYDDQIIGISIESLMLQGGVAQIQEIRDKLYEFKESGKFVTAFADVYEQKNFYLSSVADSIYVNPEGQIDFRGLSGEVLFFKDFQEKYGLKMEVIRHGKYKSAVEPFLANEMSEANREQTEAFLKSIWSEMTTDMGDNRNIDEVQINYIADELLARTPDLAIENKMITGKLYKDEYAKVLKQLGGISEESVLNAVTVKNYIASGKGRLVSSSTDRIAVIYAQGEIKYGKGDEDYIGPELIIESLKKARKSKQVKAIVLRVNSPGGSALASDIIWREIEVTKKEKPVVVSMGNMAASGGYYISCNADKIIADPTTITGSIGVFGMIPNINEFTNRIGIHAEQVGTNKRSLNYSLFEPMTDDFYNVTKEGVERVYVTFVSKVAKGRGMTFEEVDAIAQGRVWTGTQALENGLVDELGGLEDALKAAAQLADIQDFRTRSYPDYNKELKDMFSGPFASVKQQLLEDEIGLENLKIYNQFQQFSEWKGLQTRLPFLLEIR
ncbi:signal peptide peptidase SppA [Lutimonas sp.]|uniref:signal peptide peptidase SppA n=1 Tax=Lutimonas sp. TaxID=1872403 RepID=UPI003D9BA237